MDGCPAGWLDGRVAFWSGLVGELSFRSGQIPACAGMTVEGVGMTVEGTGMTVEGAGMVAEVELPNWERCRSRMGGCPAG